MQRGLATYRGMLPALLLPEPANPHWPMREEGARRAVQLVELGSTPGGRVSPMQHPLAAGTRAQLLEDAVARRRLNQAQE